MDDKETQRAPRRRRQTTPIPLTAFETHRIGDSPTVAVSAVPDHRDA
jgi:hypothetical protein